MYKLHNIYFRITVPMALRFLIWNFFLQGVRDQFTSTCILFLYSVWLMACTLNTQYSYMSFAFFQVSGWQRRGRSTERSFSSPMDLWAVQEPSYFSTCSWSASSLSWHSSYAFYTNATSSGKAWWVAIWRDVVLRDLMMMTPWIPGSPPSTTLCSYSSLVRVL